MKIKNELEINTYNIEREKQVQTEQQVENNNEDLEKTIVNLKPIVVEQKQVPTETQIEELDDTKEIDLKRIYQFKSGHNDTISSVYQLKTLTIKFLYLYYLYIIQVKYTLFYNQKLNG